MKHSNISIFVTHVGCPHMCAFCNQHTITGSSDLPRGEDVERICNQASKEIREPENTEIAFFGGSFTAIPKEYMIELLQAANCFVGDGKFKGIRISTRPDYINDDILKVLKEYHVTAIELGAQSLDDTVLDANDRGHSSKDILEASKLIKGCGFELGLQLMVGLYKSDEDIEIDNLHKVIKIKPDTVRIYPVVVLKGTKLAELYEIGKYKLMSMENVIHICSEMLETFNDMGIKVLKCGLHASEFVQRDMVAGYYHPAFKELCESEIMRSRIIREISDSCYALPAKGSDDYGKTVVKLAVSPKCVSPAIGHKKSNVEYFKDMGLNIKIVGDDSLPKYKAEIREVRACT